MVLRVVTFGLRQYAPEVADLERRPRRRYRSIGGVTDLVACFVAMSEFIVMTQRLEPTESKNHWQDLRDGVSAWTTARVDIEMPLMKPSLPRYVTTHQRPTVRTSGHGLGCL